MSRDTSFDPLPSHVSFGDTVANPPLEKWFPARVPSNIEFTTFFIKGAPNCHFSRVRVPPIFFSVTGCRKPKMLENTALE